MGGNSDDSEPRELDISDRPGPEKNVCLTSSYLRIPGTDPTPAQCVPGQCAQGHKYTSISTAQETLPSGGLPRVSLRLRRLRARRHI